MFYNIIMISMLYNDITVISVIYNIIMISMLCDIREHNII